MRIGTGSRLFVAIHCCISISDEVCSSGSIIWPSGRANTQKLKSKVNLFGHVEVALDSLNSLLAFIPISVSKYHHKFITPVRQHTANADVRGKERRNPTQDIVTYDMSLHIVNGFEFINIDDQ